ncbi:MAG: succinate dehydrogenase cytochrome b subunit [Acidobacteriota bacterium]|jgi:succinate dehydrogenase / fumarate reductase cytochrome b subunit
MRGTASPTIPNNVVSAPSALGAEEGAIMKVLSFYSTTVGKKLVMAVTGLILAVFVLGHMAGNLQIYQGPEKLNHYAQLLRVSMPLLWTVRLILLVSVVLHIVAAVQVTLQNWRSRPQKYAVSAYQEADIASRTMIWGGLVVAAFVVYHLLHLTFGTAHGDFKPGDVYHNVVSGFQVPLVSLFYILANIFLALHLYHGMWSWFQTLGFSHPKYNRARRVFATVYAVVIAVGNISIPVSVLAGWVK